MLIEKWYPTVNEKYINKGIRQFQHQINGHKIKVIHAGGWITRKYSQLFTLHVNEIKHNKKQPCRNASKCPIRWLVQIFPIYFVVMTIFIPNAILKGFRLNVVQKSKGPTVIQVSFFSLSFTGFATGVSFSFASRCLLNLPIPG